MPWKRCGVLVLLAALLPACSSRPGGTLNPTVAPGIPIGIVGVGAPRRAVLTWSPNPIATSYSVRRSLKSGGPYLEVPGGTGFPAPTFKDRGLADGTTYYYVVTASNRFGTSPPSAEVKVTPGFKAAQVAGGMNYSAAVMKDGSVWAWGSNVCGQLGMPRALRQSLVALEISVPVPVVSISCGDGHILALGIDGNVWAWGNNSRGQLGHTLGEISTVPTKVAGLSNVTAVAAGFELSLALLADGTVRAWGTNTGGQLGVGDGPDSPKPVQVQGCDGITSISSGGGNFAVRSDGTVLGWGSSGLVLGIGMFDPPFGQVVQVANLTGIVSVCAGPGHTVAVDAQGQAWAWGANNSGEVGNGTLDDTGYRIQVAPLPNIIGVAAGNYHSLAVATDGTVWAWGSSQFGTLGVDPLPALGYEPLPVQTRDLPRIISVAAGWAHSLALGEDGTVFGWGDSIYGELGNGGGGAQPLAVTIQNVDSLVDISASYSRALGVRSDGTVWCWGSDLVGEAGDGSSGVPILPAPVRATDLTDVLAAGAAQDASMALTSDGTVWTWGNNQWGYLGNGSDQPDFATVPGQIPGLTGVTSIASGYNHAMALVAGEVWSWGFNGDGETGRGGSTQPSTVPDRVRVDYATPTYLENVIAVSGGVTHSLALKSDQTVWGWALNYDDVLSNPDYPGGSYVAIPMIGLSGITAISAGWEFSLALKSDGTVWAWGDNRQGQCGQDPAATMVLDHPVAVPALNGVVAIAACGHHSLALKSDGTVWAWGTNGSGQLGDGTFLDSYDPVQVQGLTSIVKVAGGYTFSLALSSDGIAHGWGSNESGQLTASPTNSAFTPIIITH